jgi:hypothetical protein
MGASIAMTPELSQHTGLLGPDSLWRTLVLLLHRLVLVHKN